MRWKDLSCSRAVAIVEAVLLASCRSGGGRTVSALRSTTSTGPPPTTTMGTAVAVRPRVTICGNLSHPVGML